MRFFLVLLYLLIILALQTVVFGRLPVLGAVPDLVLISVIIFAIFESRQRATLFAAGSGFLQDILGFGVYINTIIKVVVSFFVGNMKESFGGGEFQLALFLVSVFTPVSLLAQGGVAYFFHNKTIGIEHFFLTIIFTTLYNLVLVPLIFLVIGRLKHE